MVKRKSKKSEKKLNNQISRQSGKIPKKTTYSVSIYTEDPRNGQTISNSYTSSDIFYSERGAIKHRDKVMKDKCFDGHSQTNVGVVIKRTKGLKETSIVSVKRKKGSSALKLNRKGETENYLNHVIDAKNRQKKKEKKVSKNGKKK